MTPRTRSPSYPFVPKSNRHLEAGQFWAIDLLSGGWACGRVLGVDRNRSHAKTVSFIGALLEWKGDERPTSEAIEGLTDYFGLLWTMHIRNISQPGGTIDGWCELGEPKLPMVLNAGKLFQAGTYVRDEQPGDWQTYKALPTLNLGAVWRLANEWIGGLDETEVAEQYRQRFEPPTD